MRKSFVYSLYAVAIPFLWCFSPPVHAGGITENFRDAVFEDYQPGQKVAVNLGSKSAQYVFSGGISKFHGLKLSERAPNNLLEVVTVRRGWWLPTADVLVPAFLFLNSEFEEIGKSEPRLYQFTRKLEEDASGAFYGATFVPVETKYIVIYTDASKKSDTIRHLMADSPSANRFVKEVFVEYGAVDSRLYAAQKVRPLDISGGFSVHQLGRRQDGNLEIRVQ